MKEEFTMTKEEFIKKWDSLDSNEKEITERIWDCLAAGILERKENGKITISADMAFDFHQTRGVPVDIFTDWVNSYLKTGKF